MQRNAGHLLPGLLKLLAVLCCSTPRFRSTQILPCDPPLFRELHWLPVVTRIRFKTMVLAFKAVNGTAPSTPTLARQHTPVRAFHSTTSADQLVPTSLRANKVHSAKSRLFSVLVPQWWNKFPINARAVESLGIFCRRLKTHLFRVYLALTFTSPVSGHNVMPDQCTYFI